MGVLEHTSKDFFEELGVADRGDTWGTVGVQLIPLINLHKMIIHPKGIPSYFDPFFRYQTWDMWVNAWT